MSYLAPLIPRYYQYDAVEAIIAYFVNGGEGNPLIVLPTGSGKSIVVAELNKRILGWPGQRVINLTHVKELIEQNVNKMYRQWPEAPVGIHSAALKRRDLHDDIIFAGIQSVYKKAFDMGSFDMGIIDESHLISPNGETMYQKFIKDMKAINPFFKIIGLTATPFRTSSGDITSGDNAIFTDICYEKPMLDLIDEGYLAPLVSKRTDTLIDLSKVKKSGGEYAPGQLQKATDQQEITEAAVTEIITFGEQRRSWLLFCAGVDHSHHVREELESRGIIAATVTGKTGSLDRESILRNYCDGNIKAVTNCDVLTTGFDAPETDLIALLRGTQSPGLYVQMCGRGTRPVYASGMPIDTNEERLASIAKSTKQNCLVLDFAGNAMHHGPVDQVRPWIPKDHGKGEAPTKVCPICDTITSASARVCKGFTYEGEGVCGHEFEFIEKAKHQAESGDSAIMSTETIIDEVEVSDVHFLFWQGKKDIPTLRVTYQKKGTMTVRFNEWITIFHENRDSRYCYRMGQTWWKRFVGVDFPEFQPWDEYQDKFNKLKELIDEHYKAPKSLIVNKSGQFPSITNYIGVDDD